MTSQTSTNESSSIRKPGKFPRGQFRLATLFLLMVTAAMAFAWWRSVESRYQRGQELQRTLAVLGGRVYVEYDGPAWVKSTPAAYLFDRIHSVRMDNLTAENVQRTIAKHPEHRARLEPLLSSEGTPGDWLLEALVEHPHLMALEWDSVPLTDRGIQHLSAFDRIEDLRLARAEIEDRHLEIIGRRLGLEDLNLNGNRITDEGISYVAGLPRLVTLELCNHPKISNAGLRQLGKLPMLSELILRGSSVTADEVAAIQRTSPDLFIEWESSDEEPAEIPIVSEEIKLD